MSRNVRPLHHLLRPIFTLAWIGHQVSWAARSLADVSSFVRYTVDVLLYHLLAFTDLPASDRERTIRLTGGVELNYRLNRGDIQGIREVWVDEVYRPPSSVRTGVVIDLGANIGLTSVFFARRCGSSMVIAVEPSAANCRMAERNFERNRVKGIVLEAAVGPTPGSALFRAARDSNLGHISSDGERVDMLSVPQLLAMTPQGDADLLKMDIEGGEGELLTGDVGWLGLVGSILAEFHPTIVDYPALVAVITKAGFSYIPGGTLRRAAADCFLRNGGTPCRGA